MVSGASCCVFKIHLLGYTFYISGFGVGLPQGPYNFAQQGGNSDGAIHLQIEG